MTANFEEKEPAIVELLFDTELILIVNMLIMFIGIYKKRKL